MQKVLIVALSGVLAWGFAEGRADAQGSYAAQQRKMQQMRVQSQLAYRQQAQMRAQQGQQKSAQQQAAWDRAQSRKKDGSCAGFAQAGKGSGSTGKGNGDADRLRDGSCQQ